MECPYCKAENRTGVRYCSNCGKLIGTATDIAGANPTPNASGSSALTSRSLTPGTRLQGGRYVIKKVLGQGGMGAALLATDLRLDSKPVVIKELLSEQPDSSHLQEDVRNFKREVVTLAHIDHPLVPNVTDHFQEGTRYFMVQEYVEGETLEERLDTILQPMKEREALIYAAEILDVLDYLTRQNPPIVHRDIKPANIIIGTNDKRAHLVDFGIARADAARNTRRKQTSALGTPGYAPPEQYQGNADPRSDLYALGATMHHLLTNRDPRNHPPFTYPPVRTLNPQLTPEIETVLERALTNDINQRYQSAAAMQQDIEDILHKRFGISGNINNYILGLSGPIRTLDTTTPGSSSPLSTHAPTINASQQTVSSSPLNQPMPPTTPASLPLISPLAPAPPPPPGQFPAQAGQAGSPISQPFGYPAYPAPAPNPYQQQPGQMGMGNIYGNPPASQFPPRQAPRKRRNPILLVGILVLLLVVIIGSVAFAASRLIPGGAGKSATPTPSTSAVKAIGVTSVNNGKESVGISDGSFVFDTTYPSSALKAQAADRIKQNDANGAIPLLDEAIARQSNDAEALIYRENERVLLSGSSYVTIVVGTMISGSDTLLGVGRDDLQGAYVAQKEFNDGAKLSSGYKVRVLIANTGGSTSNVQQVAQQVVELSKTDPTFIGVMGWPYSSRALSAVPILRQAHIPMISQTASSDELTNLSPYFFRVNPSNKLEGIAGARYAENTLHAQTAAVFYDKADSYSQSLAQDFIQQFEADGKKVVTKIEYTENKPETVSSRVQEALSQNPDLIYFSGYSGDVSAMLVNLPAGYNKPVLGGDALYELNGYPSSARGGFNLLHFTAFAYPDEWGVLGLAAQQHAFFSEYPAAFDPNNQHRNTPYGFIRAANDVILSYDATLALLTGADSALKASNGKPITPDNLRDALTKISFQGASGQVAFDASGNPVDKAMVILFVDNGHIKMEPMTIGRFKL